MKKEEGFTWQRGQKTWLCREVDISTSNLSAILHRDREISKVLALKLEKGFYKITGFECRWYEWLCNKESRHPAFYGKPEKSLFDTKTLGETYRGN